MRMELLAVGCVLEVPIVEVGKRTFRDAPGCGCEVGVGTVGTGLGTKITVDVVPEAFAAIALLSVIQSLD